MIDTGSTGPRCARVCPDLLAPPYPARAPYRRVCGLVVVYYYRTYYKAVRVGGVRIVCTMKDDEPRLVRIRLTTKH